MPGVYEGDMPPMPMMTMEASPNPVVEIQREFQKRIEFHRREAENLESMARMHRQSEKMLMAALEADSGVE